MILVLPRLSFFFLRLFAFKNEDNQVQNNVFVCGWGDLVEYFVSDIL